MEATNKKMEQYHFFLATRKNPPEELKDFLLEFEHEVNDFFKKYDLPNTIKVTDDPNLKRIEINVSVVKEINCR